jgi:hypothetical protein
MNATLTIALATLNVLVSSAVMGQSSFWLNNYLPRLVDAPVFNADGFRLEGANYLAELWGGATPDLLLPAIAPFSNQRVIVPFLSGGSAGYFRDTYDGRDGLDSPSILAVPPYDFAWLEVRAWDARLGSTYEEVAALGIGGYGESPLFYAQGGNPYDWLGIPPPLTGLQSFSLAAVVPEPSTWTLLAGGGLGLWAARRRRNRSRHARHDQ